jgi:hypothetical protein
VPVAASHVNARHDPEDPSKPAAPNGSEVPEVPKTERALDPMIESMLGPTIDAMPEPITEPSHNISESGTRNFTDAQNQSA